MEESPINDAPVACCLMAFQVLLLLLGVQDPFQGVPVKARVPSCEHEHGLLRMPQPEHQSKFEILSLQRSEV